MTGQRTPETTPSASGGLRRLVMRLALLVAAVAAINWLLSDWLAAVAERQVGAGLTAQGALAAVAALALYALLLAIPFVPGVEIGVSLLMMHGADAAPFVHAATVTGLSLAYGAGYALSERVPCGFLARMGLPRACAFIDEIKALDRAARLQRLRDAVPPWVGRWILVYRYLVLALLVNLPGNSLIGGGGGILLVAGLSRLFSFPAVLLTLILATAPVPLAVWLFGTGILG